MKGAILSIHPEARIVDLSHQIAPHRIDEARYFLKSCYREFPDGTIHVVVVDPGVGSTRRAITVKSARYFFLAPDNGVLSYIFDDEQPVEVREINQRKFRRESPGRTFDGRDLFAPAAARLAKQEPFESYGPVIGDYQTSPIAQPHWEQATLVGDVFDDAATGQGLLNFFLRGINCGAFGEEEALATGLTVEELRGRSFVQILRNRRG